MAWSARLAYAQEEAPPEPADPSPADPSSDGTAEPATEAPASEPASSEPATGEPASTEPPTDVPASAEPNVDAPTDRALIFGVSFGFAGATGAPAEVYGPGYGFGLTLGYAIGKTSIEARLGAGYAAVPKYDALEGSRTRGSFDTRTLLVRRALVVGTVGFSLAAGLATASVPLLSLGPDEFDPMMTVVSTSTVTGSGLAGSAAVHYGLGRHTELVGELLACAVLWELPGHSYVHPTSSDTSAATLPYEPRSSDVSSTPWVVSVGIRLLIDP